MARRRASKGRVRTMFTTRVEALTPEYRREAVKLFGRESDEVTKLIGQAAKKGDQAVRASLRLIDRSYTTRDGEYHQRWQEAAEALDKHTVKVAGKELQAKTGFDFSLRNPAAERAAVKRAKQLAQHVGEVSSGRISQHVRQVLREGGSVTDLRNAIRDGAFEENVTLARADRVARTEAIGALNTGEFEYATESGIFTRKSWLHSGNVRMPRDWHQAMDGEERELDQKFSNGLQHAGEAGAPAEEVVNCGCSTLYLV